MDHTNKVRPNIPEDAQQSGNLYFRIGTTYYKIIHQPLTGGTRHMKLVVWKADAIKQDHGKEFLKSIPKLDGFCQVPEHINYRRRIDGFYNRYSPLPFLPKSGQFPGNTLDFLNHIFGEQLKLGIDYFKIIYEIPQQQLPILCLVSKERETGKSTFINWLKAIFGDNMTINSNENFQSNFNSDWGNKLIIATEETLLNRKEDSERFKNLSTAKYSKIEAKGVDRQEVEFFGKFILCSNNEDNFIYLDRDEVRFWVRKIHPFPSTDPNFLSKLIDEIPYFLSYLLEKQLSTVKKTRMWFTTSQIKTKALQRLKSANINKAEFELASVLAELIDSRDDDADYICFTLGDATGYLRKRKVRNCDSGNVRRILQNEWNIRPTNTPQAYRKYYLSNEENIFNNAHKGRYYKVDQKLLQTLGFSVDFVAKIDK